VLKLPKSKGRGKDKAGEIELVNKMVVDLFAPSQQLLRARPRHLSKAETPAIPDL
jgi:hypothetical protein